MNIFDELSKKPRDILDGEMHEISVMADRIGKHFQRIYEESGNLQHKDVKPIIDFYNKEVKRSNQTARKKSCYDLLSGRASQ